MFRVMDCAGLVVLTVSLPNARLVAERVALGPEVTPVPFTETDCGLPTLSSVIVRAATRGPNWLGVKPRLTSQLDAVAKLEPHVLLT